MRQRDREKEKETERETEREEGKRDGERVVDRGKEGVMKKKLENSKKIKMIIRKK